MKIEDGKTSSDIFAACAPLEWARQVATSFVEKVWGKIVDIGKSVEKFFRDRARDLTTFFQNLVRDNEDQIQNALNALNNANDSFNNAFNDVITTIASRASTLLTPISFSLGAILMIGRSVSPEARGCLKAIGKALFQTGAVVTAISGSIVGLVVLAKKKVLTLTLSTPILGALIRSVVRTVAAAYTFNWQISDSQIRQQQNAALTALAGVAGDAAGTTLGNLLCGGVAGAAIVKFNPRLAARMWEIGGDDIKDEIVSSMNALISSVTRTAAQLAFLETYKNARTFIKAIARRPELRAILPDTWEKIIESWGNEGVKPWSFALEVEERIEKIKDEKVKAFTENAVESFMDSCQESMLAISYAV